MKLYTFGVYCTLELQVTFPEDQVEPDCDGDEGDVEPTAAALEALKARLEQCLEQQDSCFHDLEVSTDSDLLLGCHDDETDSWSTIIFPEDKSIGTIYSRKNGTKRWRRFAEAQGNVLLADGQEFRLKITSPVYGASAAATLLEKVNCDRFLEIEVSVPVSSKDYADQAISGSPWVDALITDTRNQLANILCTTANVILKPAVR